MAHSTVSIGAFATGFEAGLARGWLAERGIECELDGEIASAWLVGEIPVHTGVRLVVPTALAEQARSALAEFDARTPPTEGEAYERGLALDGADEEEQPEPEDAETEAEEEAVAAAVLSPTARADLGARYALVAGVLGLAFGIVTIACILWIGLLVVRGDVARMSWSGRRQLVGAVVLLGLRVVLVRLAYLDWGFVFV